jgi:hypothetical protein
MNAIQQNINTLRKMIEDKGIFIEHDIIEEVQTILNDIELQSTKNDINTSTPESMEQSINDLMTINIKYDIDKGITGIEDTARILRDSLLKAAYKMSQPNDEKKSPSDAEIFMLWNFGKWIKI